MRLIALIVFSLSLVGCGRVNSNLSLPSPLGSMIEVTNQYPGVGMVVLPEGQGICTGTFVSDRAVLTAAHCLSNPGRYSFVINNGTSRTVSTETKFVMGSGSVDDPHDIGLLIFEPQTANPDEIHSMGDSVGSGEILRLVGVGCNSLQTRGGAGVKRTGTNAVAYLDDYINFLTPQTYSSAARGILGPINRAGSCFGDSGGPAFAEKNGALVIVGVTHAGGYLGRDILSQYVNVGNRSDNRNWLRAKNNELGLGIQGL